MRITFLVVSLLMTGVGVWSATQMFNAVDPEPPEIGGFMLQQTRALPEFQLLDGNAESFDRDSFDGAWSFLYFGFTYCPDICPMSLAEMAKLKKILAESHPDIVAEFYLVSVDPERDTPERIDDYVSYFDDSFRGLTGDLSEISKLAQTASVIHVIEPSADGESYEVGHSSTITLLNPHGDIQAIFREPLKAASLATDFSKILNYVEIVY